MMHWYHWVLVGISIDWVLTKLVDAAKRPFRWSCPICQFKVSTNNKETIARVKLNHQHDYIEENANAKE